MHSHPTTEIMSAGRQNAALAELTQPAAHSSVWPFAITIFVSAFLLFQVQLILGKYLLPWFGGTAAVWTTSLLFFQAVLFGRLLLRALAGYPVLCNNHAAEMVSAEGIEPSTY